MSDFFGSLGKLAKKAEKTLNDPRVNQFLGNIIDDGSEDREQRSHYAQRHAGGPGDIVGGIANMFTGGGGQGAGGGGDIGGLIGNIMGGGKTGNILGSLAKGLFGKDGGQVAISALADQVFGGQGGAGGANQLANNPQAAQGIAQQLVGTGVASLAKQLLGSGGGGGLSMLAGQLISQFTGNLPFVPPNSRLKKFGDIKDEGRQTYKFGDRASGIHIKGEVQDFKTLKTFCLQEKVLFEDPEFKAEDASIFFSKAPNKPFEWLRPHEMVSNPKFFTEGASRFDVQQGELGDCWMLAAVANLTLDERLFYQVVVPDQTFDDGDYCGIFHFRFWQYGRWIDVVVDDRLPTYYGELVFLHSADKREFWSALLEKAYAKLHGSYEALKGGTTVEAMEDFTGGVTEMYELEQAPPNLFGILAKAVERSSQMGCSIDPDPNILEAELPNGLIRGHAYSITDAKYVDIKTPRVSGKIPLVRIRNPWGNEAEWKGAWSDQSAEWQYIPREEKSRLGLTFDADGEFWMSYKDFITNFQRLEICNLNPDSLEDNHEGSWKKRWQTSVFEGAWVKNSSAGGCRNSLETFWLNPQYRITLSDTDDYDDDGKCTVIVALMQKHRRQQRHLGLDCLTIGFAIYHLKNPEHLPKPLPLEFFKYNASIARSPSFINMREVSCRFKLPPGTYCVVPSTFDPNEEGEFIMRVFSEKANNMEENDQEIGVGEVDERARTEPDKDEEAEHDSLIQEFFQKVSGDDLEIDWEELQSLLNYALKKDFEGTEFNFQGFSRDVCRSMIATMDIDRSGKLGLEEFKKLWKCIRMWKNVFKLYDHENRGGLNGFELRKALNSAGYTLNSHVLDALVLRYGTKEGIITFDDFICMTVKLKTMMEKFMERDLQHTDKATFEKNDWIEATMYS